MATTPNSECTRQLPPLLPPLGNETLPKRRNTKPGKKLVRRAGRDFSQTLRRGFQMAFLALNLALGGIFYLWVRHFEAGSRSIPRPPGVEGWLPIAGLMNLKYWALTGKVPAIHPAAMFLLLTFLSMAFLLRKAFCSWLCPVGTLSEYLWRIGRRLFHRNFRMPSWIDIPLRGLKYLLLGFFVWAVSTMSAEAIDGFMRSPYGLIADVKMLNFFRFLGGTGLIVIVALVCASLFMQNFWCRYLCPYGALLGLSALLSPLRIRRLPQACIDCAKCAKACPSALPVDQLVSIKSAECTGCLECVAVCPAQGALQMSVWRGRLRSIPTWAMAAGICVLFFGIVGCAKMAGYWTSDVPAVVYQQLVPHADQTTHSVPAD